MAELNSMAAAAQRQPRSAFPGRGQSGEARDARMRQGPGLVSWT